MSYSVLVNMTSFSESVIYFIRNINHIKFNYFLNILIINIEIIL
jgi:hypothetical protein